MVFSNVFKVVIEISESFKFDHKLAEKTQDLNGPAHAENTIRFSHTNFSFFL